MIIYLACPYSHPEVFVRHCRYMKACRAASLLMKAGHTVFSPLSHGVSIMNNGELDEKDTACAFWLKQELPFLRMSNLLMVLAIDGWEESIGVNAEIDAALEWQIPNVLISEKEIPRLATYGRNA
jgi:hypothetical protein